MNLVKSFNRLSPQEKAIGIGIAFAVYFLAPKIVPAFAKKTGEIIGETATSVVIDAATGTVIGIGKAVGIPPTNVDICQQNLVKGEMWQASFNCPASTYLQALWNQSFF